MTHFLPHTLFKSTMSGLTARLRSSLMLILLAIFISPLAQAQQGNHEVGGNKLNNDGPFFGKRAKGKWIIGVKAATVEASFAELERVAAPSDLEDADAIGLVLGYEFDRPVASGTSTIELEYLDGDESRLGAVGTWDPEVVNLYFNYRSPGDLYYKLKLGVSYSDIKVVTPTLNLNTEDVSLGAGIGLGYRVGDYGVVELEYSADSGDHDVNILSMNALLEF